MARYCEGHFLTLDKAGQLVRDFLGRFCSGCSAVAPKLLHGLVADDGLLEDVVDWIWAIYFCLALQTHSLR